MFRSWDTHILTPYMTPSSLAALKLEHIFEYIIWILFHLVVKLDKLTYAVIVHICILNI